MAGGGGRHYLDHMGRARGLSACVDWLVAAVLFLEIELQLWLGPASPSPIVPSLGGAALVGAVAGRRRWPLAAASVVPVG